MKRRTVVVLIVLFGIVIVTVFAFAPVVYSPISVISCSNNNLLGLKFCMVVRSISAYESPSCAVSGIGTAYDTVTTVSPRTVSTEGISVQHGKSYPAGDAVQIGEQRVVQWSYYIGCPPKSING
jgi:hypothetical protein